MKIYLKILTAGLLLFSCSSDNDFQIDEIKTLCSVEDPSTDLIWLTEEVNRRESNITEFSKYEYISQTINNGEIIIIYANCCPTCNSVALVFNCKGENIGSVGDENIPLEVLNNDQIIWKPNNSECNF